MAVAPVDICNIALVVMLGSKPITALTDPSRAAILCNLAYAPMLDETLCGAEWNFAQVRASLGGSLSAAPSFGFSFQYQLPITPFCLKVNETDPDDAVYRIETNADGTLRVLLTNEPEIFIRYTGRITDPSLFSGSFIMALANNIAAEIAYPLTENPKVAADMIAKADRRMSRAMTTDAQEGSTQIADINVLLDVRRLGFQPFDRSRGTLPSGTPAGFGVGGFGV